MDQRASGRRRRGRREPVRESGRGGRRRRASCLRAVSLMRSCTSTTGTDGVAARSMGGGRLRLPARWRVRVLVIPALCCFRPPSTSRVRVPFALWEVALSVVWS